MRGDIQKRSVALSHLTTWVATAGFKTLRRFLAEAAKRGKVLKQLDFIAAFCRRKMRGRLFIKFDKIFNQLFPDKTLYFERPLLLKKGLYGTRHSGKFWGND